MADETNTPGEGHAYITNYQDFVDALDKSISPESLSKGRPSDKESANEAGFIVVTCIHITPLSDTSASIVIQTENGETDLDSPMDIKFPKGTFPSGWKEQFVALIENPEWRVAVTHHRQDRHKKSASASGKNSEDPGVQLRGPPPGPVSMFVANPAEPSTGLEDPVDLLFSRSVPGQITARCEVLPKTGAMLPSQSNASASNLATDADDSPSSSNRVAKNAVAKPGKVRGKRVSDGSLDGSSKGKSKLPRLSYRSKNNSKEKPKNTQAPKASNVGVEKEDDHGGHGSMTYRLRGNAKEKSKKTHASKASSVGVEREDAHGGDAGLGGESDIAHGENESLDDDKEPDNNGKEGLGETENKK